jgi:nucleoside-diphosphate-sugar epimerase
VSRILVTGASGFVGRAVVPALVAAGHDVRAAVRGVPAPFASPVEVVPHGDLGEPVDWLPALTGMECVVHLAGIAHTGPGIPAARYDRVNRHATAELAQAARAAGIERLVLVSTIRAQTGPASDGVLTEADAPRPTDDYGRSKLAAEVALAQSGVPFTVLRPVLVYGPAARGNLRALVRLCALPLPLPFGALAKRRSLVSVQNLAAAILHVHRHDACRGETYLVADPQPLSLPEIVTALRAGMGKAPGLITVPPALIRLGLTALRRTHNWDQLNGQLVVDPSKLIASGWRPDPDTKAALAATARANSEASP